MLNCQRHVNVDDDAARALVERFWPGPLTLVLPVRADAGLAAAVTAGLGAGSVSESASYDGGYVSSVGAGNGAAVQRRVHK